MFTGPYEKLETRIFQSGVQKQDLAKMIGMSYQCLYMRLAGRTEWKLYEVYQIMNALEIPLEQITELFPAGAVLSL